MTTAFDTRSAKRPRVSLLSLLLLLTCVAMGLGVWRAHQRAEGFRREMSRALRENNRLRNEAGEFTVTDPERLYADWVRRDLTSATDNRYWAWRVWVPEGRRYQLTYGDGVVPFEGFPPSNARRLVDPGDYTIQLWFEHDPSFGDERPWVANLSVQHRTEGAEGNWSTRRRMMEPAWPAIDAAKRPKSGALFQPDEGVGWGVVTVDSDHSEAPDERVVLQRLRVREVPPKPGGYQGYDGIPGFDPKADAPGFVIWLEPAR